jgi:Glycosyltransferase family 9 (heptosyltransferase)/Family of unknown function (DUF6165)
LLPAGPTYVALAPGAGVKHTGKCWPLDCFVTLARQQVTRERVPVFFIGPAERDWCAPLHQAVPEALFPEQQGDAATPAASRGPSLVAALAERVSAAVSNCSGTGHLLAAGGAPMVSLYGPTRPEKYAPFSRALICIKAQDFGSDRLEAIPVDVVASALERQVLVGPAFPQMLAPQSKAESAPLLVPISVGELLDKITILEIKAERISDPARQANVIRELDWLRAVRLRDVGPTRELETLFRALGAVNRQLWDIEDRLREAERGKQFDLDFIELARSVYRCNDQRAALKRKINQLTGSEITEEKSYLDQ